ncbi:hypothetical protein Patl1_22114 [Pistacia atlantica]|uniref:Uncharacterized protein n=1 Tax=Pistacia atlantica TaxID=434234 RepID=A0ACC1BMK4_9ROSI|nr:hypothetical protein Patl1_22114 [Pistacia atlantica]
MVFNSFTSRVLIIWATTFTCSVAIDISDKVVAASKLSSLQLEKEALLKTSWWDPINNISNHCKWVGITCNSAGSIICIDLWYPQYNIEGELSQINFSCFPNLKNFSIVNSSLSGYIPSQIGALSKLKFLSLSNNNLTGVIPPEIGSLNNLMRLNLSLNKFTGSITSTIGHLTNLEYLDLSSNKLGGFLPPELGNLKNLTFLDLSNNNLIGPIPSTLCPYILLGPPKNGVSFLNPQKKVSPSLKILIPITIFVSILIFGFLILLKRKDEEAKPETRATKARDVFSIWNYGGYGSVYRAQLPNGKVVALKKLHNLETKESTFLNSFQNEAHVLSKLRNRNIIKLYGFCLHKKCMFLIYEYMERGSLFCVLRNDDEAIELDWSKRVNIVKNMAHALSYLHHDCTPSIVHRDISSNNILLNSELEAFIADFGLARLLHPDS